MSEPLSIDGELRGDGGHQQILRVYYEDTDFTGVVYHANYFKYFERARSNFLRLLGIHHHELEAGHAGEPCAFAVTRIDTTFKAPARIDDLVEIGTEALEITAARIRLKQIIKRGDAKLVEAEVEVVVIDKSGKPLKLPEMIKEKLSDRHFRAGMQESGGEKP